MNMELSRRQFLKGAGAGVAGTALSAFGFGEVEKAYADAIRAFKLSATTETRNTCPYCSVACGIIMYSKGDVTKGEKAQITHIEGDVDHPTNRGTLCPKGAALLDFVHSETRLTKPRIRKPGADRFEEISWDDALNRIVRLSKSCVYLIVERVTVLESCRYQSLTGGVPLHGVEDESAEDEACQES